eukprot:2490915-Rhodomonas_salina.1
MAWKRSRWRDHEGQVGYIHCRGGTCESVHTTHERGPTKQATGLRRCTTPSSALCCKHNRTKADTRSLAVITGYWKKVPYCPLNLKLLRVCNANTSASTSSSSRNFSSSSPPMGRRVAPPAEKEEPRHEKPSGRIIPARSRPFL